MTAQHDRKRRNTMKEEREETVSMFRDNENKNLRGDLFLTIEHGDGACDRTAHRNLIVTGGRNALAKLLGGQTGMHISSIAVGTGSVPAADGDSAITNPVSVPISDVRVGSDLEDEDGTVFESPNVVQFHFVFPRDAAVGVQIGEYGLFCADGTLFSRVVRDTAFEKTALDKITGFWQITF